MNSNTSDTNMEGEDTPVTATGWRSFLDPSQANFWAGLIGLGIVLRLVGSQISALNVDAHLHVAYAINYVESGVFALDWGPARNPFFPAASDPLGEGVEVGWKYAVWHLWLVGWIGVFGRSENTIHLSSLVISAILLYTTWRLTKSRFGRPAALRITALVSIHPSLIASSISGMQEEAIALFLLLGCASVLTGLDQYRDGKLAIAWLAIAPVGLAISMIKGMGITMPLVAALLAIMWLRIERSESVKNGILSKQPLLILIAVGALIWAALLIPAWLDPSAGWALSFAVFHPFLLIQGIILTILFFGILWFAIGLLAWPYAGELFAKVKAGDLPSGALHLLYFVGLSFCVVILMNASFWAHEGFLLGLSVPGIAVEYWRNGRYVSLLLIPFQWLLMVLTFRPPRTQENPQSEATDTELVGNFTAPKSEDAFTLGAKPKAILMTMVILVAMSFVVLFIDRHDAEDVSEQVATLLEKNDEFLLITPQKAGMHRLYEHHMGVDADMSKNILGHWRSDSHDWRSELAGCEQINQTSGNLSQISVIILDPLTFGDVDPNWAEQDSVSAGWRVFIWSGTTPRCPVS